MKNFRVLLAPVFPGESPRVTRHFLGNALVFASWAGARLRVFSEQSNSKLDEVLEDLRCQSCCESVEFSMETVGRGHLKKTLKELGADGGAEVLGLSLEKGYLGKPVMSRLKSEIFLETDLPSLILPASLTLEYPPVLSLLVAMAGDRRLSVALHLAISIGNEAGMPVDLLHVTENQKSEGDRSLLGEISDEFQHEYPGKVAEFISEASPFSSEKEKLCIRNFSHMRGDAARLIQNQMHEHKRGLLVMEWKGHLRTGRAAVLRSILRHADYPVLLVRPEAQGHARLRIGKDFPLAG